MALNKQLHYEFASNVLAKEFNKALNLIDKREWHKAIVLLNKVKRKQEFKEVFLNLGVAYKGINDLDNCKKAFLKAMDSSVPFCNATFIDNWPIAINNLGLAFLSEEKDDIAEQCFKRTLEVDPLYYDAIWNMSLVKLRAYCSNKFDDLSLAWTYYTYRFQRNNAEPLKNKKVELTMWDFKTPGDSIVVLIEQGIGDAIMFTRYLPELKKYFPKIWIQTIPEMYSLFSEYNVCSDATETDALVGVPMCSLGKLLDYIPTGEWLADKYVEKKRIDKLEILCIGTGNISHVNSHNRNIPMFYFDKLKQYGNLHSTDKRKDYKLMPIIDWASTIKYLENIDIVVTIDSSVAHLCGALGKPCLVFMPLYDCDWRWGDKSMGFDNKWYNSVKVIRNQGSWEKTFTTVETILKKLSNMQT